MDTDYRRAANITVIVIGIAAFLWLFFKYALAAVIPFILAALVAAIISPLAKSISKKTRISKKITAVALVVLFFAAICALIYLALSRLIFELGNLLDRLSEDPGIINRTVEQILEKLNAKDSKLGILQNILDSETFKSLGIDIGQMVESAVSSIASSLAQKVSGAVMGILSSVPSLVLSIIVFLISAFYFATDSQAILDAISGIFPHSLKERMPKIKGKLSSTLRGYLKAYLLIMLITFLEVFVGLSILKINYAFILAMVIAIVDVLPILGTGTVLVPWSVFAFINSDIALGIGLLVLYAVTIIVRQIIEPKIIGSTLGIHPLLTLASVYIGLELLGFIGIFIGPVIAMLLFGVKAKNPSEQSPTLPVESQVNTKQ